MGRVDYCKPCLAVAKVLSPLAFLVGSLPSEKVLASTHQISPARQDWRLVTSCAWKTLFRVPA